VGEWKGKEEGGGDAAYIRHASYTGNDQGTGSLCLITFLCRYGRAGKAVLDGDWERVYLLCIFAELS
jgi:hypothetical protein